MHGSLTWRLLMARTAGAVLRRLRVVAEPSVASRGVAALPWLKVQRAGAPAQPSPLEIRCRQPLALGPALIAPHSKAAMQRTIEVLVDKSHGHAHLVRGLRSTAAWHCNVLPCLLTTGYLSAPPRYRALSPSTVWAWLRYSVAISNDPGLRLHDEWDELDAHQKTILSDDFGLGFPSYYLVEQHGFEDFADTHHLLGTTLKGRVRHRTKARRGPSKTPDLLCIDRRGHIHVLECKGTQSSHEYLRRAVEAGIAQKRNVVPVGRKSIIASAMVGGIFVPQARSVEHAQLRFVDPEPALPELELLGEEFVGAAIRRQSLAKALSMCGLWEMAEAVDQGAVTPKQALAVHQRRTLRLHEFRAQDESWRRSVRYAGLAGHEGGAACVTTLEMRVPRALEEFIRSSLGSNGSLPLDELDMWLAQQRAQLRRRIHGSNDDGASIVDDPSAAHAPGWLTSSTADADASSSAATISLPSGIEFRLSVQTLAPEPAG